MYFIDWITNDRVSFVKAIVITKKYRMSRWDVIFVRAGRSWYPRSLGLDTQPSSVNGFLSFLLYMGFGKTSQKESI
jgi:hypothetical protein